MIHHNRRDYFSCLADHVCELSPVLSPVLLSVKQCIVVYLSLLCPLMELVLVSSPCKACIGLMLLSVFLWCLCWSSLLSISLLFNNHIAYVCTCTLHKACSYNDYEIISKLTDFILAIYSCHLKISVTASKLKVTCLPGNLMPW